MANFLAELKRRHLYRVAAAYAVVAWVLLQLVNNVAPVLDLPIWVARAFLLALIIGFPITLLFAWMRELAPMDGTTPRAVTGKLDWFLASALVVVIALVLYGQLAPTRSAATQQAGIEAERTAAVAPAGISIAVLPFTNLSSDKEQEFFSDGMTEEITSALARVPDLRVVARTSAFEYKGKAINIKTMGQALGATHLIEGSVRKAGDRVRITVQLIRTDDGTHIWAEDYDRQLTDIFAIQEDIARAITASLRMPLGLKPGENLVNNRSIDAGSYQQFLRARALAQAGAGQARFAQVTAMLEQVVTRNPEYAPAWGALAGAYYTTVLSHPVQITGSIDEYRRVVDAYLPKADSAARRATQLDPNSLPDMTTWLSSSLRTGTCSWRAN